MFNDDSHTHADKCALCILTRWQGRLLVLLFPDTLGLNSVSFFEKYKKEWRQTACALGVCHLESLVSGF